MIKPERDDAPRVIGGDAFGLDLKDKFTSCSDEQIDEWRAGPTPRRPPRRWPRRPRDPCPAANRLRMGMPRDADATAKMSARCGLAYRNQNGRSMTMARKSRKSDCLHDAIETGNSRTPIAELNITTEMMILMLRDELSRLTKEVNGCIDIAIARARDAENGSDQALTDQCDVELATLSNIVSPLCESARATYRPGANPGPRKKPETAVEGISRSNVVRTQHDKPRSMGRHPPAAPRT